MGNPPFEDVSPIKNGWFSIAMLVYVRVFLDHLQPLSPNKKSAQQWHMHFGPFVELLFCNVDQTLSLWETPSLHRRFSQRFDKFTSSFTRGGWFASDLRPKIGRRFLGDPPFFQTKIPRKHQPEFVTIDLGRYRDFIHGRFFSIVVDCWLLNLQIKHLSFSRYFPDWTPKKP